MGKEKDACTSYSREGEHRSCDMAHVSMNMCEGIAGLKGTGVLSLVGKCVFVVYKQRDKKNLDDSLRGDAYVRGEGRRVFVIVVSAGK